MRNLIRMLILSTAILASGCIVVPVGHPYHCGYYHCR